MAVAVEGKPYIVLDEEYRIVGLGSAVEAQFGEFLGENVWELFPGSRSVFFPYLEEAHRTGDPVEFVQFYDGTVVRVVAVPEARRITASWEVLGTVDVSTLDNLRSSLGDIASVLVEQENVQVGGNRPTLRVVGSDA